MVLGFFTQNCSHWPRQSVLHSSWADGAYHIWFSMLLLPRLFSFLFLVKCTFGVKERRLCGGNCLFACAHAVAYRTEKSFWIKGGKKVLAFCGYVVILEQTGVSDWKGCIEDYIKAHPAKTSGFKVLLSSELSAVERVILLSLWICRALIYHYFSGEF